MSEPDLAASLGEMVKESNTHGSPGSAEALAARLSELPDEDGVARIVLEALRGAGPRAWVRLDDELRYCDRQRRAAERVEPSSALGVLRALCSADGRVREEALRRSDELPRLLPMVVIRAADWAAPVRDAARAALPGLLRDALGTADGRAVGLVALATSLAGRRRGGFVVELVARLLADVPSEVLAAVRRADDRFVRRMACDVWLGRPDTDVLDILDAALTEPDNVCRSRCARFVVEQALAEHRPDLVEPLLAAAGGDLRALALEALVRMGRPGKGRAFLGDRSGGVRSVAQWAVRRDGEDPVSFYREALPAGADDGTAAVAGLVLGLGECGTREDMAIAAPFLRHGTPRVRAAAVRAVSALGGRGGGWAALLADPAPAVVRTVSRTMLALEVTVPVEELRELLAAARPLHVRRAAYLLLIRRDTWTRLDADLRLLAARDPELGEVARADLLDWLRREAATAYGRPLGGGLERLVRDVGGVLPEEAERRLRWHLGL
ncbi:hypothetical protein AB0L06_41230 [Spirillospora sp. NPDC052269]